MLPTSVLRSASKRSCSVLPRAHTFGVTSTRTRTVDALNLVSSMRSTSSMSTNTTTATVARSTSMRSGWVAEQKSFNAHNRNFASTSGKPAMFCMQCEQTQEHKGCTTVGNCGKTADVASIQDHLIECLKGLGYWTHRAGQMGVAIPLECHTFTAAALFATMTNVNFDLKRFPAFIAEAVAWRDKNRKAYLDACKQKGIMADAGTPTANHTPENVKDADSLSEEGKKFGVLERKEKYGDDVAGLQELLMYGLKGVGAYQTHAVELGQHVQGTYNLLQEALAALADPNLAADANAMIGLSLKTGEANLHTMAALEEGHISHFGNPEPTQVRISAVAGKCILVSGHDMWMLEDLLKQTEGKGINVYTHGELLPANTYPKLKQYKHLVGNYGGAWQLQKIEFARFPGPIIVTTNCLVEPRASYKDRVFTMGEVGFSDVQHLGKNEFGAVINKALECKGFEETEKEKFIPAGFGKNVILSVADKILGAVQSGSLKRFFVIGGCDGAEGERSYYKDLAVATPQDTAILTLGCGKYRFNKMDLGTIQGLGIPRVLDMGQCNDAYGAIAVALALAKALKTDVNSLPISYAISWFEQKAVAVFLTMLHLGVKNIRLGPALPAFVTPNTLKFLVEKFDLKAANVKDVQADLKQMMAGK